MRLGGKKVQVRLKQFTSLTTRSWAGRQAGDYAEKRKQTSDWELSRFMTARSKFPWSCRGREDKFSSRRHTKTGFTCLWLSLTRVRWRSSNESLRMLVLRACQLIAHRCNKRGGVANPCPVMDSLACWKIPHSPRPWQNRPKWVVLQGRSDIYLKRFILSLYFWFLFSFFDRPFCWKKWKISEWHRQISVLYLLIPPCIAFFFMWRNTK